MTYGTAAQEILYDDWLSKAYTSMTVQQEAFLLGLSSALLFEMRGAECESTDQSK
jgi:hypothetical protein